MPQDMIGCWNQRKLKSLTPRMLVFTNDPSSAVRRILLSFLLFHGLVVGKYALICALEIPKIQILRICLIYGTNVSVSRSRIPLQVVNLERRTRCPLIYQQTSASRNAVHVKTGFYFKV